MRKDTLEQNLPTPDEACASHHRPHEGEEAPDLAAIKLFPSLLHRYELQQDRGNSYFDILDSTRRVHIDGGLSGA